MGAMKPIKQLKTTETRFTCDNFSLPDGRALVGCTILSISISFISLTKLANDFNKIPTTVPIINEVVFIIPCEEIIYAVA